MVKFGEFIMILEFHRQGRNTGSAFTGERREVRWGVMPSRLACGRPLVVQQGLRTPTELRFENCCTRGIRGLLFGSPFTRRSTKPTALFFAVA